jgi:hypothetical protein
MSRNKENLRYSNISDNVGSINEFVCEYFQNSKILSTSTNDNPSIDLNTINSSRKNCFSFNNENRNYAIDGDNRAIEEIIAIDEYNAKKCNKNFVKKDIYFHNPEINKKMFSMSTLKYLAIFLVGLALISSFFYFLIVAILNFNACTIDNNTDIPVYLITLGIAGILRIFLFFSCPYSYTESLVFKMYEHLVWRLAINRFKSSYYSAALVYATYSTSTNEGEKFLTVKQSIFFLKLKCFISFVLSFFCCNFVCISFCNNLFDTNSETNILFRKRQKSSNIEVNLKLFIFIAVNTGRPRI